MQAAIYERSHLFVHAYGVLWQDHTGKAPGKAHARHRPLVLCGTTLSFLHKALMAAAFGAFSHEVASRAQIGLLVCPRARAALFALSHCIASPCARFADATKSGTESVQYSTCHTHATRTHVQRATEGMRAACS